jgi:hypothetical protein
VEAHDSDQSGALLDEHEVYDLPQDNGRLAECPQCGRLGYRHMADCPHNHLSRKRVTGK